MVVNTGIRKALHGCATTRTHGRGWRLRRFVVPVQAPQTSGNCSPGTSATGTAPFGAARFLAQKPNGWSLPCQLRRAKRGRREALNLQCTRFFNNKMLRTTAASRRVWLLLGCLRALGALHAHTMPPAGAPLREVTRLARVAEPPGGLIPYRAGALWGYADTTGRVVIRPSWELDNIRETTFFNRASPWS